MSGTYILFWQKKKIRKCFLTLLKWAFSVSCHKLRAKSDWQPLSIAWQNTQVSYFKSACWRSSIIQNTLLSSETYSRQSSKHLRNMKPMKRKSDCPRTSSRKRKKQRKTTESISEHKKTTLAQSDKGSWFDQVNWLEEEESNVSISARKLCSEIDSEDRTEKRNSIVVDINLLNGAIKRLLVCKSCQCPVFCEELEERSGQGVRLGFVCTNANCSLIQMPFNSSSKSGKLFDINRASTLAFRAIGRGQLAAAKTLSILGLPKPLSKPVWCENTKIIADACSELVREELEQSAREKCHALLNFYKKCFQLPILEL